MRVRVNACTCGEWVRDQWVSETIAGILVNVHWWCLMHVRSLRSDIASTTANRSLAASFGLYASAQRGGIA